MSAMDAQLDRAIDYFCCSPRTAVYGPYESPEGPGIPPRGEALIPGCLYRYRVVDSNRLPVDIQVYSGVSELGGVLWEQEVRVLLRVGMSGRPGLAEVLGGGFQDEQQVTHAIGANELLGVAVAVTRGSNLTMSDESAVPYMYERPIEALRQFVILAEALAALHDLGVCHRNLWPGSIDATTSDPPELWIARFEMSALMANLFQNSVMDRQQEGSGLRGLYLSQPERSVQFCPPERLAFLYPGSGPVPLLEDEYADVFSLAAIVWEWFCGPVPGGLSIPTGTGPAEIADRLAQLNAHRLARLAPSSRDIPEPLAELLRTMLDWSVPRSRPSAAEVVETLSRLYERILAFWEPHETDKPYLIGYMPEESKRTVYAWGWLEHSPDTDPGRRELGELIKDDLRRAVLLHSPHGAAPFVGGDSRDITQRREARHLLLGANAAWFCTNYRPSAGFGQLGKAMDNVLLIKYVVRRDLPAVRTKLAPLASTLFRREMPELLAVPTDMDAVRFAATAVGHPSWKPLTDAVRPTRNSSEQELVYEEAIDWLLEYQGMELLARTYAFENSGDSQGGLTVQLDPDRDEQWVRQSSLLAKYRDSGLRSPLGDFFGSLDSPDGLLPEVEVLADDRGRPSRAGPGVRALVKRKAGADRVDLELVHRWDRLPTFGWIRPLDDRGSRSALQHQLDERWELLGNRPLLSQLRSPRSIRMLPHRWARAGEHLSGKDGKRAVREILTQEPFFAVQGPPGTGKTTVTAEAVARYLTVYPGNRVLLSAQSNFALDNLAQRVMQRLGAIDEDGSPTDRWDGVALRVVSRTAMVDEAIKPWMGGRLAERRAEWIRAAARPAAHQLGEHTTAALEQWRHALDDGTGDSILPELGDRLRRAANLVFATCAMATSANVTPMGLRSTVDWVVVEEAAKAWPTELAVPLCRGTRWTLIGDHKQLPAHRRNDIIRFLDSCADDPDEDIRHLAERRDDYVRAFDLFRSLFDDEADRSKTTAGPAVLKANLERPLLTLGTQYRMRVPIKEVVSRVFYPVRSGRIQDDGLPLGILHGGEEVPVSPLTTPRWLAGQSLVWIDTGDSPDCADEPQWSNEGEARIVRSVVDLLAPRPVPPGAASGGPSLAVLSPYRKQNQLLAHRGLGPYLSTVHAFQGREADIVVVSLVRDRVRADTRSRPWASLGHLGSPDLINVMFSRARQLLVIVGNFDHFSRFGPTPEPVVAWDGDSELTAPESDAADRTRSRSAPWPGPRPRGGTPPVETKPRTADSDPVDGRFWSQVCRAVELNGTLLSAADLLPGDGT